MPHLTTDRQDASHKAASWDKLTDSTVSNHTTLSGQESQRFYADHQDPCAVLLTAARDNPERSRIRVGVKRPHGNKRIASLAFDPVDETIDTAVAHLQQNKATIIKAITKRVKAMRQSPMSLRGKPMATILNTVLLQDLDLPLQIHPVSTKQLQIEDPTIIRVTIVHSGKDDEFAIPASWAAMADHPDAKLSQDINVDIRRLQVSLAPVTREKWSLPPLCVSMASRPRRQEDLNNVDTAGVRIATYHERKRIYADSGSTRFIEGIVIRTASDRYTCRTQSASSPRQSICAKVARTGRDGSQSLS